MAGRCRPLSKFMEFLQDLILMASVACLSQYPLTDLTTLAFPQYSDTIVDVAPCHCILVFCQSDLKCFFDSPVYTPSQSLQGTWYTIPFFFSSGTRDFTRISTCFEVLAVVKHCGC